MKLIEVVDDFVEVVDDVVEVVEVVDGQQDGYDCYDYHQNNHEKLQYQHRYRHPETHITNH